MFAISLFLILSVASATEEEDGPRWYVMEATKTDIAFEDHASRRDEGQNVIMWTQMFPYTRRADGISSIKQMWTINCRSRTIGSLGYVTYNSNGQALRKNLEPGAVTLEPVVPDSSGENILNDACQAKSPGPWPVQVGLSLAIARTTRLVQLGITPTKASLLASMNPKNDPILMNFLNDPEYVPATRRKAVLAIFGL